MYGMFWIALDVSIPKIGFNIMLSLTVKKVDVFKFDRVAESATLLATSRQPFAAEFLLLSSFLIITI